jgi:hypothetical protein
VLSCSCSCSCSSVRSVSSMHSRQRSCQQRVRSHQPCHCLLSCLQDPSHQRTSAPQPSALLHCLSQLNTDAWAQVLLPKLIEQGSAANVALTCSQLRELCYSSRQCINLGAFLDSSEPSSLKSVVSGLPMHFPYCSAVSLRLGSDKSYHTMPYLLPALAQ